MHLEYEKPHIIMMYIYAFKNEMLHTRLAHTT